MFISNYLTTYWAVYLPTLHACLAHFDFMNMLSRETNSEQVLLG